MKGEPAIATMQPGCQHIDPQLPILRRLKANHPWRLSVVLLGMLFARGRRTVTTWLGLLLDRDELSGWLGSYDQYRAERAATFPIGSPATTPSRC